MRDKLVLEKRDRFIAGRVNETLKVGEVGLIFLGLLVLASIGWFGWFRRVVRINRGFILGHPDPTLLGSLAWLLVVGAAAFFTAIALMKRRLIK